MCAVRIVPQIIQAQSRYGQDVLRTLLGLWRQLGDMLRLVVAMLTALGAIVVAMMLIGSQARPVAVLAAILAVAGSACWVVVAIAVVMERKRPR